MLYFIIFNNNNSGTFYYHDFSLNKDAIYGIEVGPFAKELGFRDGDIIISVNERIPRTFNDIYSIIQNETSPAVKVLRDNNELLIELEDEDAYRVRTSRKVLFVPKQATGDSNSPLHFTEDRRGLNDAVKCYLNMISDIYLLFAPNKYILQESITAYDTGTIKGLMLSVSYHLVFLGLINLIPFPGLATGNIIMIGLQKVLNKSISQRNLIIVKISGVIITTLVVLVSIIT